MNVNWFKSLLTLLHLGIVLALAFNREFYSEGLISAYFSLAVMGAVIILLSLRPHLADLVLLLLGTCLLSLTDYFVFRYKWHIMTLFSFLGLTAIAILGIRSIWAQPRQRKMLLYGLVPLLLFTLSEWMATPLLDLTEKLHPRTLDLFLYSFDESLGVQLSFVTGKWFAWWPLLRSVCLIFYVALPIPLALVYGRQLVAKGERVLPLMIVFLIAGPVGVIFYNLFPAAGPVHIFGGRFPFDPLSSAQISHLLLEPTPLHAARNALPSLHMAWVLLAWWNSKGLSIITRIIVFTFVVLTVVATLGTGEHYLIDLIVAFPFALMLQSLALLSLKERDNRIAFLFGATTTLGWMGLLRFTPRLFWLSPAIPWTLASLTVLASIWLKEKLQIPPLFSAESIDGAREPILTPTVDAAQYLETGKL